MYTVKEIYFTLQGEGAQSGRAAIFCRFAGCNLWSGLERDRAKAVCRFCDTDFVGHDGPGGGRFKDAEALAAACSRIWAARGTDAKRLAVLTGGEPMLQVDLPLIDALHAAGFEVAIETNGTLPVPPQIDWICVSPKAGAELVQRSGNEIKVVFPQEGIALEEMETLDFDHYFLQPMDGDQRARATEEALRYALEHPRWRLSLQTHKLIGIP
ncbi:MAG: 7-carboxy-7-deazaguanine synthase [Methyloligellaceae bacterium]